MLKITYWLAYYTAFAAHTSKSSFRLPVRLSSARNKRNKIIWRVLISACACTWVTSLVTKSEEKKSILLICIQHSISSWKSSSQERQWSETSPWIFLHFSCFLQSIASIYTSKIPIQLMLHVSKTWLVTTLKSHPPWLNSVKFKDHILLSHFTLALFYSIQQSSTAIRTQSVCGVLKLKK